MKTRSLAASAVTLSVLGSHAQAGAQLLGTADTFAVLAGSTVTNTGNSVLNGNLGVWPGLAYTGFPPGKVNGTIYAGNAVAEQAEADLTTAYNTIQSEAYTTDLTGMDLGGLVLFPGVYHFASSAFLDGALTLDGEGNPNSEWDFQIGSTLITGSNASVNVIAGGECNVYWQVGSSATLGTGTAFLGNIMAQASITMNTGSSIVHGSALAETAAVTLDDSSITTCLATPEPMPVCVLGLGVMGLLLRRRQSRS